MHARNINNPMSGQIQQIEVHRTNLSFKSFSLKIDESHQVSDGKQGKFDVEDPF